MPHPRFIEGLRRPEAYSHPCGPIEIIETHISWVLLTGDHAYKIKKPVELGFLDYRGLDRRRHFCEEELRLNRRLAPKLYLEVLPITGTPDAPRMGGDGKAMEYAVHMRQFDQADLLPNRMAAGPLSGELLDELAHRMAAFHTRIDSVPPDTPYGTPAVVLQTMLDNFAALRRFLEPGDLPAGLEALEQWTRDRNRDLEGLLEARRRDGFVRECHGDMHLGNIALIDGEVTIFDGIEFNPGLRWIDVMSEVAFLLMDLDDRGAPRAARRVLNVYLQDTGDYGGLRLLRMFQTYRAMVRAKVEAIRAGQPDLDAGSARGHVRGSARYVALAAGYTRTHARHLIITHGVSGSGKSAVSRELAQSMDAVWLRSDVERKRLFGMQAAERGNGELDGGIYSPQAGRRTYERLSDLAGEALGAGFSVIVDATFLEQSRRRAFRDLARQAGVDFHILDIGADEAVLRSRVQRRMEAGADPSDADLRVLESQLARREPLSAEEAALAIPVDTAVLAPEAAAGRVNAALAKAKS